MKVLKNMLKITRLVFRRKPLYVRFTRQIGAGVVGPEWFSIDINKPGNKVFKKAYKKSMRRLNKIKKLKGVKT